MPPTYSSLLVLGESVSNLTFTPKCAHLHVTVRTGYCSIITLVPPQVAK